MLEQGIGRPIALILLIGAFQPASWAVETLWKKHFRAGIPDTSVIAADIHSNPGLELLFNTTSGKVIMTDLDGNTIWSISTNGVFCNPPTVADIFPGGGLEVLSISRQGVLKCFSSKGEELWETRLPAGLEWNQTTIVASDLDRDGGIDILVGDREGNFERVDRFGRGRPFGRFPGGVNCPPAAGDLDSDGYPEIVLTSLDGSLISLSHEEDPEFLAQIGSSNISGPVLADLDLDGEYEIIVGAEFPFLQCFSHDGTRLWKVPTGEKGIDSTISVGNLVGDDRLEIVCINLAGECFCFDSEGQELWKTDLGGRSRRAPSIADFNADGNMEVLASGYFGQAVLLSNEGKEIERVPIGKTNGGATLIDYQGRLAAVLPIDDGSLVCLTWQTEAKEELPAIAWGSYRYDSSQSGAEPIPNPKISLRPIPEKRLGSPEILDLSPEVEKLTTVLSQIVDLETSLADKGVRLQDLQSRRYELLDLLAAAKEANGNRAEGNEEEFVRLRRKSQLVVEIIHRVLAKGKKIFDLAQGARIPPLVVWPTNPWWHIRGIEEETYQETAFEGEGVLLYRNEVESVAFNLMNLDTRSVPVRIKFPTLMGGERSPQLEVLEVISVPTEVDDYADDALAQMNQARTIHLAPGETRQVFVSIHAKDSPPGSYQSQILFEPVSTFSEPVAASVTAEVVNLDVQEGVAPWLCTWGFLNNSHFKDFPKEARHDESAHGNNVAVVSTDHLPVVQYDESGGVQTEIDFSRLGEFVKDRIGSMFLFLAYSGSLQGPEGHGLFSPAYEKAFDTWLGALVDYMDSLGVGYDRFALYPVDEPGLNPGLVDLYISHARLTRKADPDVLMYTDPVDRADMNDIRRMAHLVDIWCPNRNGFLLKDDPRLDVMKNNSTMMWTYECEHLAKHRPPLEYYRGLAWLAKMRGLSGIGFWSYCTSVDDPWRFPEKGAHDYLLVYPGEGIVTSRRWEAVRDAIEDLRAIALLESEIEKGGSPQDLQSATQTLQAALSELGQFGIRGTGADNFEVLGKDWIAPATVDTEWYSYRLHRSRIAEATLRMRNR